MLASSGTLKNPVIATVVVLDYGGLTIQAMPAEGWEPAGWQGLVAAVVLAALIMSLLLASILILL